MKGDWTAFQKAKRLPAWKPPRQEVIEDLCGRTEAKDRFGYGEENRKNGKKEGGWAD
jgi:hypothetical protein